MTSVIEPVPQGARMPSHVKIFFALVLLLAAWWLAAMLFFFLSPPDATSAALARLPLLERGRAVRMVLMVVTLSTLFWSAVAVTLAALAAFGRRNWARWTFILVFVLRELHGMIDIAHHFGSFAPLLPDPRRDPSFYATKFILVAAIGFVLTGNAKAWFRRAAPTV